MENKTNLLSHLNITGIITAVISGLFATMNLSLEKNNPLLSITLYAFTLICVVVVIIAYILKKSKGKHNTSNFEGIIRIQEEIDSIHLIETRAKQFTAVDNILFRLNRKILNLFIEALKKYCSETNHFLNTNIERSEPFLYYKEIIEEISEDNKKILRSTIQQNNLDKISAPDYETYKDGKIQLFWANAENIRNAKYSDEICIVPLDYLIAHHNQTLTDLWQNELSIMFDQIRDISIKESARIKELNNQLQDLKNKLK